MGVQDGDPRALAKLVYNYVITLVYDTYHYIKKGVIN